MEAAVPQFFENGNAANPYPTNLEGQFNWNADPCGWFYDAWKECNAAEARRAMAQSGVAHED